MKPTYTPPEYDDPVLRILFPGAEVPAWALAHHAATAERDCRMKTLSFLFPGETFMGVSRFKRQPNRLEFIVLRQRSSDARRDLEEYELVRTLAYEDFGILLP